ncbi:MAG TPA: alanine racemase [Aeromicrobium sp.]|nr:alanine racemase [Aeromicrobium sp.]
MDEPARARGPGMTFDLVVDAPRWRGHLDAFHSGVPGLVPVVKGNGYGFGRPVLLAEAARLEAPRVAVGTYPEAVEALDAFAGDVLVMTPWRPYFDGTAVEAALADERVIHTISRLDDVEAIAGAATRSVRVVVEGETSMARHGFDRHELAAVAAAAAGVVELEGFGIHLPLMPTNLAEADAWAGRLLASQLDTQTLYVSHLTPAELAELRTRRPDLDIRPRVGTALWLGDLGALSVRASVLDVHQVTRGERVGYRQRAMPRDGYLLVLSGGTSHGLGLEAPRASRSAMDRVKRLARGGLEAAGFALSPFVVAGRQRWFAEPPHMQASLVFLPASVTPPEPGDTVSAAVRFTTSHFDSVVLS